MQQVNVNGLELHEWLPKVLEDHRDKIIAEFHAQLRLASDRAHDGKTVGAQMLPDSFTELSLRNIDSQVDAQCKNQDQSPKKATGLPKPSFLRPSAFNDCQVATPWPDDVNVRAPEKFPSSREGSSQQYDLIAPETISSHVLDCEIVLRKSANHRVRMSNVVECCSDSRDSSSYLLRESNRDEVSPCGQAVERKLMFAHTTSELFKATYSKSGWKHSRKHMKSRITELSSEAEKNMTEFISQNLYQRQPYEVQMFDYGVGVMIMLNTITMFAQLQWEGHISAVSLGIFADDGAWRYGDITFKVLEHTFNAVFLVELILRIFMMRRRYRTLSLTFRKYFAEKTNLADFALVILSSVHLYFLAPLSDLNKSQLSIVSVLRLGRTVRVLRVMRVFKLFQELRILVSTFIASMWALVWAMVFMFVVILVAALFVSFSTQDFMREAANEHSTKVFLYNHYGNGFHAMYCLFEATMSGCWPNYFRTLIDKVSRWYVVFVILYVSIVVFGLTRVITAMFLKETLRISQGDAETQAAEQFKKKHMYIEKLRETFQAIDVSGDGQLNYSEFKRMCTNPEVQVILRMLELDIEDADAVFNMLDTRSTGEIGFEDFLKGVLRLKGQARSLDMIAIMITTEAMHMAMDDMHSRVYKIERLLRLLVDNAFESDTKETLQNRAVSMWK